MEANRITVVVSVTCRARDSVPSSNNLPTRVFSCDLTDMAHLLTHVRLPNRVCKYIQFHHRVGRSIEWRFDDWVDARSILERTNNQLKLRSHCRPMMKSAYCELRQRAKCVYHLLP